MNKTRRSSIISALAEKIKTIKLGNGYMTDLAEEVFTKMIFPDEINEWPCVCLTAGAETIVHQGGGAKDRYLDVLVRVYVNEEDSVLALESLLEDIESVIDSNGRLAYTDASGNLCYTRDIILILIDTDQGALNPLGVGEMTLQVKY